MAMTTRPAGASEDVSRFLAHRGLVYRFVIDSYWPDFAEEPTAGYTLWVSDGSIAGQGIALAVDPGQTVQSVLRGGLHTVVTARRAAQIRVDLLVDPREARRLGLHRRVLGSVSGNVGSNTRVPAVMRPTATAARALKGRSSLKASVRVTTLRAAPEPDRHPARPPAQLSQPWRPLRLLPGRARDESRSRTPGSVQPQRLSGVARGCLRLPKTACIQPVAPSCARKARGDATAVRGGVRAR